MMGVNPILGPLEGMGPENLAFFGPVCPNQNHYVPRHINERYGTLKVVTNEK